MALVTHVGPSDNSNEPRGLVQGTGSANGQESLLDSKPHGDRAVNTDGTAVSFTTDADGGPDWTAHAMCVGKTDLFFAPPGERDGRRRRREALACAYCDCCAVKEMCRLAGRLGREHGLWGGENDEERAAAGFAPRSPHRRAVAKAARIARQESEDTSDVA